jgi:hypothetical protein
MYMAVCVYMAVYMAVCVSRSNMYMAVCVSRSNFSTTSSGWSVARELPLHNGKLPGEEPRVLHRGVASNK